MKTILATLLLLAMGATASAETYKFKGPWKTVRNRKLEGIMVCDAVQSGTNWTGTFHGVWQGVSYKYKVPFKSEQRDGYVVLTGKATIDGASYTWTGTIKDGVFDGTFQGNRYDGFFTLKRQ